jgi:hypothetical protein
LKHILLLDFSERNTSGESNSYTSQAPSVSGRYEFLRLAEEAIESSNSK